MERTDYPAMLPQLQPSQAVDVLQDRVKQVTKINTSIADWLQERRRLEEQYSAGLRRLAKDKLDGVDLGVFSVPWTSITDSADTLAEAHSTLASKIEIDVERPLREFSNTNREMQGMSTIQGNLASMAKDVDRAQQKTDRLNRKGDDRATHADSELSNAQSSWESQAPYVFENLQSVDEARLNHLRDVLTQLQTHEIDSMDKSRQTAEHCLNVLLQVETTDEIKTFVLKTLGNAGKPRPKPVPAISSRAPLTQDILSPSRSIPDNASQHSGSMTEDKRKSRFGGLKRLGTVMRSSKDSDKRKSKMPAQLESMAESPEMGGKTRSSPFGSMGKFGRKGSTPHLPPPSRNSEARPPSPLRMGSEVLEPPSSSQNIEPASPSPAQRGMGSRVNGTAVAAGAAGVAGVGGLGVATAAMLNGHQSDLADIEPPAPAQQEIQPAAVSSPVKDSEGYSMPPQDMDAITQAQRDASALSDSGEGSSNAFNVNIRDKPIEDGQATDLSSAATKLQAPPAVMPRSAGTLRGRRAGRPVSMMPGEQSQIVESPPPAAASPIAEASSPASPPALEQARSMEAPPTMQSPAALVPSQSGAFSPGPLPTSTFTPFNPSSSQISPIRPESRMISPDATGDNQSIRSGRSTASQGFRHPELNESGLNSSIVETVSARFEEGKMISSSLIGEIALAYNPADFSSPFGNENIRLEKFSSLEKVAPNPAFITQSATNKEGEYAVNLSSIAKTQVAFKYQLKNTGSTSHAPLLIAPAYRIEATQASVIVSYSLNPEFNLQGKESITLSNVMLALTLEGAAATSCQSRPAGTFAREKNLIFWQLGEVTLKAGAAPEKVLARFATETEAKTGHVEARWEVTGDNARGVGSELEVSMQGAPAASDGSDPFADEDAANSAAGWKSVAGAKKLTSGSYVAK